MDNAHSLSRRGNIRVEIYKYVGEKYNIIDPLKNSVKGYYNSHLVFILALLPLAYVGLLNKTFLAFLIVSLIIGLLCYPDKNSLSIKVLPLQIIAYLELFLKWFKDSCLAFFISFVIYLILGRWIQSNLSIFGGPFYAFIILYGIYFLMRIYFFCRYALAIGFNWNKTQLFPIKLLNTATPKLAFIHLIWAFFMSNIGLTVRCGKQLMIIWIFEKIISGAHIAYPILNLGTISNLIIWSVCIAIFIYVGQFFMEAIYYKIHRTLHENKTLFIFIHRIHHVAIFPIVFDSGTRSPFEFLLTEPAGCVSALFPDWLFVAVECGLVVAHFVGHNTVIKKDGYLNYHVDHHRLVNVNYGINPFGDKVFNTFFTGKFYESLPS